MHNDNYYNVSMAIIHFNKLTFRNFMSYGNNLNTFTFPDGMIWFSADNGAGKSTVVEALNFALFGVSYRGGNNGDLRNTKNMDADLEVSLEFDTKEGLKDPDWRHIRIFRTLNPAGRSKFDVEIKDAEGKWVKQNKRAGFGQKDFEDVILGFNEVLFKAVIAQNTQETQPFMQLGAADRRKLTESIISMPMDVIKKENAKKTSGAQLEFDVQTAEYNRLGQEISNADIIIAKMKEEQATNIDNMKQEMAYLQGQIAKNVEDSGKLEPEITSKLTEITKLDAIIADEFRLTTRMATLESAFKAMSVLSAYESDAETAKVTFDTMTAKCSQYSVDEWNASVNECNQEINTRTAKVDGITRDLFRIEADIRQFTKLKSDTEQSANSLVAGVPCPTCGKPSTEADIEGHKVELRKQWKQYNKSVNDLNEQYANETAEQKTLNSEIDELRVRLSSIQAKLSEYSVFYNSEYLPSKGQYDAAVQKVQQCRDVLMNAGVAVDAISSEIDDIKEKLTNIEANKAERQRICDKVNELRLSQSQIVAGNPTMQARINAINAEIARLEANIGENALSMAMNRRKEAIAEQETAKSRIDAADDTLSLCKAIADMVADGGMKKMIFDIFVPNFNKAVAANLIKANLPFTITFDSTMNYKFESSPGYAPTFDMLSQGQKRKVGFAISLAFRDFVTMVGNFRVNFLSLDEVLDISTDDNAMRDMLELIKIMADDIGCVSVITHRGSVVSDMFNYKLTINSDGAYSRIGKLESI